MQKYLHLALGILLMFGCASDHEVGPAHLSLKDPRSADPFDVVDCLLPGQIRQLGTRVTYLTERRPIRTTAEDCAIRGGEYVALDRADYGTALKVWMSAAEGGDPDAQYYVGVLYEKGAEGPPDYPKAASWYRQAAERGVSRAAVNLGRLYEQGIGVEKSSAEAGKWFAKASGMREGTLVDVGGGSSNAPSGAPQAQLDIVQQELENERSRLAERTSLLDDERRKLQQLKGDGRRPDNQAASTAGDVIANQERLIKARESEVAKLQLQVLSLKESAQKQVSLVRQSPTQDLGLGGPSLQIVDPPVIVTRGIRVEQGRIPVVIQSGRPMRLTGRVIAQAGLRSLTANGASVVVDEQGTFSLPVQTSQGTSRGVPMDLVAIDRQDKQGSMKLMVRSGAAALGEEETTTGISRVGQYHALVIGNDHYRQWTPLNTAIADATAVAKVLQDHYGFHVKVLKDSSRKETLKALNDYRKTLSERDDLLIYYAGHGFLEPEIDRGYWIPVEGDLQDNSEWIEFPAVTDLLELIPAKQVLVVADSCFAGKLVRSAMARLNPELQDQARQLLLKTIADKKIRTTLTSGGAKPVLDDGGAGHSIFAAAFLSVLSENTTALETERLFWTVRARVAEAAERMKVEQIPTYGPIHMAGHEGLGDFVFVPAQARP
jgi:uncharacterized caspase-like protein